MYNGIVYYFALIEEFQILFFTLSMTYENALAEIVSANKLTADQTALLEQNISANCF